MFSMHSGICAPVWFKLGMMRDTTEFYILVVTYNNYDLDFDSRLQGYKKATTTKKLICQLSLKFVNGFGLKLVQSVFKGENPF